MKFNKRGIIIIVALVVLAIVGIGGYGVYSYYYTEGEFTNSGYDEETDTNFDTKIVFNKKFDPRVSTDGDYSWFLCRDGYMSIQCGTMDVEGYITCVGQVKVINNGSDPIDVQVIDAEYSIMEGGSGYIDDSNFNWTRTSINAGQYTMLNLILRVPLLSDEYYETESSGWSYNNEMYEVDVSFKLEASNHVE